MYEQRITGDTAHIAKETQKQPHGSFVFFAEHPGEHLEAILSENNNHEANYYTYSIPGLILNELGYSFFDPEKDYEIKRFEGKELVIASAFESYEPPDEDGFGAEYNYDWWFLDENMQPIPGVRKVNATIRDIRRPYFTNVRDKAVEILQKRHLNHSSRNDSH